MSLYFSRWDGPKLQYRAVERTREGVKRESLGWIVVGVLDHPDPHNGSGSLYKTLWEIIELKIFKIPCSMFNVQCWHCNDVILIGNVDCI